jgi:hypothetical protein
MSTNAVIYRVNSPLLEISPYSSSTYQLILKQNMRINAQKFEKAAECLIFRKTKLFRSAYLMAAMHKLPYILWCHSPQSYAVYCNRETDLIQGWTGVGSTRGSGLHFCKFGRVGSFEFFFLFNIYTY